MSRFGRSSARASLLALALLSFATSCAGASGWRAAEHKLREQGLLHDVSPGAVTFRADAPGDDAPPPDPLPPAEAKVRAAREILEDLKKDRGEDPSNDVSEIRMTLDEFKALLSSQYRGKAALLSPRSRKRHTKRAPDGTRTPREQKV